jgi:hypothetical protein
VKLYLGEEVKEKGSWEINCLGCFGGAGSREPELTRLDFRRATLAFTLVLSSMRDLKAVDLDGQMRRGS